MIIILGILIAIAVPSYLNFKDRANKAAAEANVRAVLPDVEFYNADNVPGGTNDPDVSTTDSGYQGMTTAILTAKYDQTFPRTVWTSTDRNPLTGVGVRTLHFGCSDLPCKSRRWSQAGSNR